MTDRPKFFTPPACRAALADLADLAADPDLPIPAHVEGCARCAASIASARLASGLLKSMRRPRVPETLAFPGFLTGVYERADAAIRSESIGASLRDGLVPAVAPRASDQEPVWHGAALESAGRGSAAADLVASLPRPPTPGWLWTRIRANLREGLSADRRQRRRVGALRMAAAAAFLLAVSWAVRHDWSAKLLDRGTSPDAAIVGGFEIEFVPVMNPTALSDSPAAVFRTIAHTPTSGR